jgi:hypothetical protein
MAIARATAIFRTPAATAQPQPAERAAQGGPSQGTIVQPASHIRRCTFRRVTALPHGRRELPIYDVDCMHPTYDAAVRLGDLPAAYAACGSCTLPGIFRPDED